MTFVGVYVLVLGTTDGCVIMCDIESIMEYGSGSGKERERETSVDGDHEHDK